MTSSRLATALGSIDVPDTWELRMELRFTEPEIKGARVPLAANSRSEAARTILTVTREPASKRTAETAASEYLRELASAAPQLKRLREETVELAGGIAARVLAVSFEVAPGTRALQQHLFRIDDETLTQITATVEERGKSAVEDRIDVMMRSYRPG